MYLKAASIFQKNTANGKEDFQGKFVVNVFTLKRDGLSV